MSIASRTFASGFVVSLLAACAVGPDYQQPDLATPAQFQNRQGIDQRQAAPAADLVTWWQGFGDPLLTRLVTQALADNLDIAQALARVSQSRAALQFATAALLPSGEVSAQAARAHLSLQTPQGRVLDAIPGFDRNGGYYEAGIGAGWEIDVFGGQRRDREAAIAEYQASRAGIAAARLAVAAQTADLYVGIRGLQARLAIANQQAETQRRLLSTIKLQYEAGVAAELQMRQAEGALAQVEAGIPVLEAALESVSNALDVLLGTQPGTHRAELALPSPIPVAPAIADAGGPADLIRRRPDLIVAERRLAAANARIGAAISEYYPKLSLSGLLGTATTVSGNLFDGGANQARATLGLRWRIFDFVRVDAEIAAARGRNAESLAAYKLSVLRASQDVEDAFSMLVRREAQASSLASGETSYVRARDASLAAYKGGVVSLIEVLDADSRLLTTRDARAQAQTEAARAAIASFRALGGGWNPAENAGS
ncbi:efflux transporter outer membrane subunit [Nevskia ramosa]|uniref:efflux transporter outer membrane subunit n=1 Tax=Nevskia ramosa TaxID=64002 RepID=UPI002357910F|nr:efflux transporter outer membrane subunit [Nevskia ramosa]